MAEQLGDSGRNEILQQQITRYVSAGWVLADQTNDSASFTQKKKFSFWWALLWFLLGVIPLIFYVIYYAAKNDPSLYLVVDEFGNISKTESH